MTLEEQKKKLAAARAKAQGTLAREDSGEVTLGPTHGGVRGACLGYDRDGLRYWKLLCADAFQGLFFVLMPYLAWAKVFAAMHVMLQHNSDHIKGFRCVSAKSCLIACYPDQVVWCSVFRKTLCSNCAKEKFPQS